MMARKYATFMKEREIRVRPPGQTHLELLERFERRSCEAPFRTPRATRDPRELSVVGAQQDSDDVGLAVRPGAQYEGAGADILHGVVLAASAQNLHRVDIRRVVPIYALPGSTGLRSGAASTGFQ